MAWLDRLLGNDRERASQYEGRESASQAAARKRREGHRRSITKTARQADAWEQRDRQQDNQGRWYRPAR